MLHIEKGGPRRISRARRSGLQAALMLAADLILSLSLSIFSSLLTTQLMSGLSTNNLALECSLVRLAWGLVLAMVIRGLPG